MGESKTRESSIELIRVIAQYFIVLYHLLMVIVYKNTGVEFYRVIWLPLHIGVPLFVMISGYFRIKTDIKRLVKLIGMVFVLQVPLLITNLLLTGGSLKEYISLFFFVSGTPFWFVRTYICLFLFAPIINNYLNGCTIRQRVLLLAVLFFISIYIGSLKFDSSLSDGKNLVLFLFYYVIGDTLHVYESKWKSIPGKYLTVGYLIINIVLVAIFTFFDKNRIVTAVFYRFFFEYTSIGLLLNSIAFFMIIGGLKFHSSLVNSIGKSSLAIYMIHGTPLVIYTVLPPLIMSIYWKMNANIPLVMIALMIVTGLIVIGCWLIYLAFNPIWKYIGRLGDVAQKKYDILIQKRAK